MKIMLDSGAFSVWRSGLSINLDDYIAFCKTYKNVSYFVNLDIIPKGHQKSESACEQSWSNYQKMVRNLPRGKVIPVFHQGENIRWLQKYLDLTSYVGISPDNKKSYADRLQWIRKLRVKVGGCEAKFHGFAVASYGMLEGFPWHSVDSTTWAQHARVWQILIPKMKRGQYDYRETPLVVKLSPRNTRTGNYHINSLSPMVKEQVLSYVNDNRMRLGKFLVCKCSNGYKTKKGEYWLNKTGREVVKTEEIGLSTDIEQRMLLNSRYYLEMAKSLSISDFYLSGMSSVPEWINEVPCILVSFNHIPKGFRKWL